jgi:ATP-binding cassette, subfamily B, bacterial
VLPSLVIVAMGRVTGSIPGAVSHGLSSSAGHHLPVALAVAGGVCAARSRARSRWPRPRRP